MDRAELNNMIKSTTKIKVTDCSTCYGTGYVKISKHKANSVAPHIDACKACINREG